ncbi:MAG: putative ABC transporter permease [Ruminococcus sp.]|nr:putative ABC transporter permease [Ruminococcus sp.]
MVYFTYLLWVFVIFSFLGWFVQFIAECIKKRRPVNPGFITLPFLPSNGIGMFLVFILLHNIKNFFILFVASALLLTLYKYLLSSVFERSFGFKWKNYSKKRFNLNGYVSVWEPFAYGAIGFLSVKFAFNPMISLLSTIPLWIAFLIPAVITVMILSDCIISVITVINLWKNLKGMKNISELIGSDKSSIPDDELRKSYERRILKSKRFRLRLVKAFPDMQSLNYEKQLQDIKTRFDIIREKNNETYERKIENDDEKPFAFGLSFSKLFWLFFIGSFFGTVLETIWGLIMDGYFQMRVGMVIGPFIPVYGGGAVAITLCLYKLYRKGDVVVYLVSAAIGATFEYLCSYFQEMFLGTISWDYSDSPFNLDGRTNLTYALIWGFLGLAWLRYLYPLVSRLIEKIPKKPGTIITVILCVFMAFDGALSILAVDRKNRRAENIPPKTVIGEAVDYVFNDDYMDFVFPNMKVTKKSKKTK